MPLNKFSNCLFWKCALDSIYELKQKMALLERAHASAGMGHFVLDHKRMTIEFSSWVRDNIGLNDMPIPLDRLSEIVAEDAREEFNQNLTKTLEDLSDFSFETVVVTAKGAKRMQRISGITAFENERTREGVIGLFGILQEITHEKQSKEQLRAARDSAQAELTARASILGVVSHEIRTPLSGILGIIEQIKRERSAAERERALMIIEEASEVLLDTLDGILQQARLGSDEGNLESKPFRPLAVAQRVAELFRPLARRKGLRIEVTGKADISAIGDPARLQQIIANIVSNAVKFTPSGLVLIGVTEPLEATKEWIITVSDTGVGMDPETVERLFEAFGPSGQDSLGRSLGAGLGLSITKDLLDAMAGHIKVESTPGHGTTFAINVPLGISEEEVETDRVSTTRGQLATLLSRSTDLIRVEAFASTHGFNMREGDAGSFEGALPDERFWLVADIEKLAAISPKSLERCDKVIALIPGTKSEHDIGAISNALQTQIEAVSNDQLTRALSDLAVGLNDDAA